MNPPRRYLLAAAIPLILVVAVGVGLRCYRLGEVGYWFDEGFCWKMTTFSWKELGSRVALDSHPPLYLALLKVWRELFGESPGTLRALSALCGVATILGGYRLVSRLERDRAPDDPLAARLAGLVAAALLALSPLQIEWSQQLRMYALGAALAVWSSDALVAALQSSAHPIRRWSLYVATAAALAYTHYFGLFLIAAHALYALGVTWAAQRDASGRITSLLRVSLPFLVIGLLWLPWVPRFLVHRQQVQHAFWTGRLDPFNFSAVLFQMGMGTWTDWFSYGPLACGVALVALMVWGLQLTFCRGERLLALAPLVTVLLAVGVSIAGRNIVIPRYFLFAQTLAVCGLATLLWRIPGPGPRGVVAAGVLLGFGWLGLGVAERRDRWAAKPGFPAAIATLERDREPGGRGEPVFVANPMVQVTAVASARSGRDFFVVGSPSSFSHFHGVGALREDEFASPEEAAASSTHRIWLVDAIRWTGETNRVSVPEGWTIVRSETFPDWSGPDAELVVRECVRSAEPAPEKPPLQAGPEGL